MVDCPELAGGRLISKDEHDALLKMHLQVQQTDETPSSFSCCPVPLTPRTVQLKKAVTETQVLFAAEGRIHADWGCRAGGGSCRV